MGGNVLKATFSSLIIWRIESKSIYLLHIFFDLGFPNHSLEVGSFLHQPLFTLNFKL